MEAPKCPKCGERHWSTQACKGSVPKAERLANVAIPSAIESANSSTYKGRDPEKRREYQKELMRKRRAK